MNLGEAAIRIRERSAIEVLDVTFLFLKGRPAAFGGLALALVLPVAWAAWWAIEQSDPYGFGESWYVAFVVAATAATLVRGPTLLLCGRAMFDERATLRTVLPEILRHLGSVLGLVLWRFALSVTVVGLFFDGLRNYFRDEVLLLERPRGKETQERMDYLRRRFGPDGREQAALHLVLTGAFVAGGWSLWVMARLLVTDEAEVAWWPSGPGEPALVASFLLAQVYLAAAKFLYYLNLRTVNEGWDLFLETRGIQAELDRRRALGEGRAARGAAALVLAVVLGLAGGGVARAADEAPADRASADAAQGDVREALEEGRYPWYDAATDGPNWELLREELEVAGLEDRGTNWVAWLLNAVAATILIGVLVYIVRTLLAARRERPPAPDLEEAAPALIPFEDADLGVDPDAWLASARALAAAGDYPGAIVHLFNHELLALDRAQRIRLAPGRTNRHHLLELGEAGAARLHFRSTIRVFESVYYGGRGADRDDYARFEQEHERLLGAVTRSTP